MDSEFNTQTPQYPSSPEIIEKRENIFTGTIGAALGALIGAAMIILLGQLNFIASLSGFVLAVCTLKGYEILGGKRSTVGIIICIILMAVTPYFAERVSITIAFLRELEIPFSEYSEYFGEFFRELPGWIEEAGESATYYRDLAMLYLFTALGAFGTLRNAFKKN